MTGLEKIVQQIRDEAQQAADAGRRTGEGGGRAARREGGGGRADAVRRDPGKSKTDVQNHLAAARSAAELAQRRAVLAAKPG